MYRESREFISVFHRCVASRSSPYAFEARRRKDVESGRTLADESTGGMSGSSEAEGPQFTC